MLAALISTIGYSEGRFTHRRERALPTGTMQLIVNLDRDELDTYPDGYGAPAQHTRRRRPAGSVRPSRSD